MELPFFSLHVKNGTVSILKKCMLKYLRVPCYAFCNHQITGQMWRQIWHNVNNSWMWVPGWKWNTSGFCYTGTISSTFLILKILIIKVKENIKHKYLIICWLLSWQEKSDVFSSQLDSLEIRKIQLYVTVAPWPLLDGNV